MDEDLKIVLTSELEADEQASAQRIAAQLPNIAKLINAKSSIKVGVNLDEANIQTQAQRISQQITRATKTQGIGVRLNLDQASVSKIKTELDSLKVDPDISRAMTDQLDRMGIQIDRITGKWETINGQEERMLNLTIQGTDQMQRTVTYLQTYNTETGEINTHLTNVTANLERQRKAQEQIAAAEKRDNESRIAFLTKQKSLIDNLYSSYTGDTSAKPILDEGHLSTLNAEVERISSSITQLSAETGKLTQDQRARIAAQIEDLKRLVQQYQNAEYVATKLRTKDIGTIKSDQLSNLEALEKRLEAAGILTDTFRQKIDELKTSLSGVSTKDQLVSFLNNFDQLNNDVSVFQERLRGVNKIYTQMISLDKQITSVQNEMLKLNPEQDENKLSALREQLAILNDQRSAVEAQLGPYSDIVQYANQASAYEQARLMNGSKLVVTEMEIADKAREYDAAMRTVNTTVSDLEAKYRQIAQPTETLAQNMRTLRETAAAYNSEMGNQEKVQTYEKMQQLIGACSKEMSELMRIQRSDVNDFKFTQNLEKAKADLETVGRTWSALKQDPGLNAQFQQLQQNLKVVDNQMDLNKWTSQFSAFKAEVKAAGKNMQSLGDVLKNNVGKVLQWVSATTLLFRAFRLLRSAISEIIKLDTAMVDLQKVTVATKSEYDSFYRSANDTAKALGVTTEEVISQTAEWARLGYAMKDAAKLAENSAIFEAISPDMDITQATDGLVSIIKAYDMDVEDSLDGIISKINDIGNKFAVSNGDIVEVMTRTSSAMASANNTFEETVALATAAIEVTRDAATVGNGLKTLSMRIRGYDEETEEYTNDVVELTGAIADLTKVASNNFTGVSLFEVDDPETYRSTYDILSDISDIWYELTDKNRADLLETLFGKRQAQIGSAILKNFDQARKAIKDMEESAGSAEREMAKIEQSLEYKLNALNETWVGVAQNLFKTDDMKMVVDGLTAISSVVETLTDRLGLFGTAGLAVTIAGLVRLNSTISTVTPTLQNLSTINFDGSTASVLQYATALSSLDPVQQKMAMRMLGMNAEQQNQVNTMIMATAALRQYTVAELEQIAGLEAGHLAQALNVSSTAMVTEETLKAAVASGALTEAQLTAVLSTNAQTAANTASAGSFFALAASAKAAITAIAMNPMTWIALAPVLIGAVTKAFDALIVTAEEATEKMEESFSEFENAANEASSLNQELDTAISRINELEAKDSLTFVEESELQKLRESVELLQIQADLAEKERVRAAKESAKDTVTAYRKNYKNSISSGAVQEYLNTSSSTGNNAALFMDDSNISAVLAGIEQMKRLRDEVETTSDEYVHFQNLIEDATDSVWEQAKVLNTYKSNLEAIPYDELTEDQKAALDEINEAIKLIYETLDPAKWKSIQWNSIINNSQYADDVRALEKLAAEAEITADTIKEQFPALAQACADAGLEIDDVVDNINASFERTDGEGISTYTANLKNLSDVISDLQTSYDLLEAAQKDMADGNGLSPETINKLADAEENYLDYLYEENGVVKLNTEAWKENANAKMLGEMNEIQKEIDSIKAQNDALRENIAYYEEQRKIGNDGGIWTELIAQATAAIEENNKAIEENQGKLAVYSSLYGSITGDLDAYTSALQNFSNIANSIDNVTSSFQTLADLQAEVAKGFTMSLDKAMEFAKVYPEILNSAQVAADGQITLNKDVVNSFIEGKKAEIDAQIDAQIVQLQVDKEVLEAKLASAQAQLELVKNVGEGEGQIAKETAEYRINVGNALTSALIDMGIDEATAYELATAAMAENEEEFARVAKEAFENMDENAAKAAYNMAHSIFINADNACKSISDIAAQAHETAKAISAMGNGEVAGSSVSKFSGTDGKRSGGLSLDLYHGDFKGSNYDYDSKTLDLDEYVSQIELDISNYESAIKQIDGQIAALEALKNAPLKSFKSKSGSSSGSSKEVEEYIADVDKYRDAVEALRKAQAEAARIEGEIENAKSYEKKIALHKDLIAAYQEEQAALHNLNDARDATITEGVNALRELGFAVEYNADTNELWISNMEHLNDLTAESKGKYNTLQEATNELRKGTENLIDTITDLNDENRKGSATWKELQQNIIEATIAQYEYAIQLQKNTAMLAENGMDNAISTKSLEDVKKFSAAIISEYKNMQRTIQEEADYYRSLGYSETSDEVSKLTDLWWDYADSIKDVKERVVDYLLDIVDAAHDSVDEIQKVSDTLHDAADEFAANGGFITVDTYQELLKLGPQYMQMLKDENGLWEINEERINDVVAARTRQLAVENAMSYVERLKLAAQEGSIEDLNYLCFATTNATNATWGLVYAELQLMHTMGELNDSQYQAALHNIQAMQDLAENAVANIGKATDAVAKNLEETRKQLEATKDGLEDLLDELKDMEDGANDLIKYVMDMLKHRIKEQIDLLKEMKSNYSDIIQLKKDSLDATKNEQNYQKTIAKKLKEMAKLQERINALSLDDSRSAQAERAKLLEQMAELQEDLAETQADKSIEAQKDALDQMEKDYHEEKDAEIKILEDSISSYQKLYDMAINYIRNHWDTLYSELIAWNTEYGSVLNSEITEAWEAAQAAAQRYGDFVSAIMGGISSEIDGITRQIEALNSQISNLSSSTSSGSSSFGPTTSGTANSDTNTTVGSKTTNTSPTNEEMVRTIVGRMKECSAAWSPNNDKATNDALHQKSVALAQQLDQYGVHAEYNPGDGTWKITRDIINPGNVGKLLQSCYHTGGFVGSAPLKPNERYIKAENGELVLTSDQQDSIATQISRISAVADKLSNIDTFADVKSLMSEMSQLTKTVVNNVTNNSNQPIEIHFGDTIINAPSDSAKVIADEVKNISRDNMNQIAHMLRIRL